MPGPASASESVTLPLPVALAACMSASDFNFKLNLKFNLKPANGSELKKHWQSLALAMSLPLARRAVPVVP